MTLHHFYIHLPVWLQIVIAVALVLAGIWDAFNFKRN
jgi:hypothetical protein